MNNMVKKNEIKIINLGFKRIIKGPLGNMTTSGGITKKILKKQNPSINRHQIKSTLYQFDKQSYYEVMEENKKLEKAKKRELEKLLKKTGANKDEIKKIQKSNFKKGSKIIKKIADRKNEKS